MDECVSWVCVCVSVGGMWWLRMWWWPTPCRELGTSRFFWFYKIYVHRTARSVGHMQRYLYWRATDTPFHCSIAKFPAIKFPANCRIPAAKGIHPKQRKKQHRKKYNKTPLFCLLRKLIFEKKKKTYSFICQVCHCAYALQSKTY